MSEVGSEIIFLLSSPPSQMFSSLYVFSSFHGTVGSQITCLSVFSSAILHLYNGYQFSNWNLTDSCKIESIHNAMTLEVLFSPFFLRNHNTA